MFTGIKAKFKANPKVYYALSICATWGGIGSLMNGITMMQTYGVIPSLIWVLGNVLACMSRELRLFRKRTGPGQRRRPAPR